MKKPFYAVFAAFLLIPATISADPIKLTSFDQTVRLTGTFVGMGADVYIINFNGHLVEVPVAGVTCEGRDCPDLVSRGKSLARLDGH